ncbi:MAG: glycosyltransferase family 4 protein [Streptomycetales bacterium]
MDTNPDRSVLLLAPSIGLGGGIERYVSTLEAAFQEHEVPYRRVDLLDGDRPPGGLAKLRFIREAMRAMRASRHPVQLVLAHRNLLPIASLLSRRYDLTSVCVILYGVEVWDRRLGSGRAMRRPHVRAIAISNFSAGALAGTCRANVLHPGVSATWYGTLVDAATRAQPEDGGIHLVTTFRLQAWRDKGLDTLLDALDLLDDERVRLTICGTGPVPAELTAKLARRPWCRVASDLTDRALADLLAGADLFVLATRTRYGSDAAGEGFGLVLLEAQLAGTPVIAPAYGGSGDAFQDGLTGLAPIDESPEALASVLAVLLGDERRRTEMGRAAASWSRAAFDPATYSGRVVTTLLGDATTASYLRVPSGGVTLDPSGIPDRTRSVLLPATIEIARLYRVLRDNAPDVIGDVDGKAMLMKYVEQ